MHQRHSVLYIDRLSAAWQAQRPNFIEQDYLILALGLNHVIEMKFAGGLEARYGATGKSLLDRFYDSDWLPYAKAGNYMGGLKNLITRIEEFFKGEDSKRGQSCTITLQPSQPIQNAIDTINDGAVICLTAGTWQENLVIKKNLTLMGDPVHTVIKGQNLANPVIAVISDDAIGVFVRSVIINNVGNGRFGISVFGPIEFFLNQSQILGNSDAGFVIVGAARVRIQDSVFNNNKGCGIWVSSKAAHVQGTSQMLGNGADLCGFASATLRRPLASQTTRTHLSVPGDFQSLQEAVDAIAPGGIIKISSGIYETGLTIWKPLTLQGTGRAQTILKTLPTNRLMASITGEAQGVTIEGVSMTGSQRESLLIYGQAILEDVEISNNGLNSSEGITVEVNGEALVKLNSVSISGNGLHGLMVAGSATVSLRNSQISNNGFSGIFVEQMAKVEMNQALIENNGNNSHKLDWIGDGLTIHGESQVTDPAQRAGLFNVKGYGKTGGFSSPSKGRGIQAHCVVKIVNSIVRNNSHWGIATMLKICGWSSDMFTGKVIFQGNNIIQGNKQGDVCLPDTQSTGTKIQGRLVVQDPNSVSWTGAGIQVIAQDTRDKTRTWSTFTRADGSFEISLGHAAEGQVQLLIRAENEFVKVTCDPKSILCSLVGPAKEPSSYEETIGSTITIKPGDSTDVSTLTLSKNIEAFLPLMVIFQAQQVSALGQQIKVRWPVGCKDAFARYYRDTREIEICQDGGLANPSVALQTKIQTILHEYGHAIIFQARDGFPELKSQGSCSAEPMDKESAWLEGWADFVAAVIYSKKFDPSTKVIFLSCALEPRPSAPTGADVERTVLKVLWDLYDGPGQNEEDWDTVNLSYEEHYRILARVGSKAPADIMEFANLLLQEHPDLQDAIITIFRNNGIELQTNQTGTTQSCTVTVQPSQSIQTAINNAAEGAVICLAAGSWAENVVVQKSLTIKGAGHDSTVIKAVVPYRPVLHISGNAAIKIQIENLAVTGAFGSPGGGDKNGVLLRGQAEAILKGIKVFNNEAAGVDASDSAQATLEDSIVTGHASVGINARGAAQLTLRNTTVSGNGNDAYAGSGGITLEGSAVLNLVNSSISENAGAYALSLCILFSCNARATITDSKIINNGHTGLYAGESAQVELVGSTVSNNKQGGAVLGSSSTAKIENSNISSNGERGLSVSDRSQVQLLNANISDNGHDGLVVRHFSTVEVSKSTIAHNGTDPECNKVNVICSGINVIDAPQLSIADSRIMNNTDWGLTAEKEACGFGDNEFIGAVNLQGSNAIVDNNKSSNHAGQGNPEGQICLP